MYHLILRVHRWLQRVAGRGNDPRTVSGLENVRVDPAPPVAADQSQPGEHDQDRLANSVLAEGILSAEELARLKEAQRHFRQGGGSAGASED